MDLYTQTGVKLYFYTTGQCYDSSLSLHTHHFNATSHYVSLLDSRFWRPQSYILPTKLAKMLPASQYVTPAAATHEYYLPQGSLLGISSIRLHIETTLIGRCSKWDLTTGDLRRRLDGKWFTLIPCSRGLLCLDYTQRYKQF